MCDKTKKSANQFYVDMFYKQKMTPGLYASFRRHIADLFNLDIIPDAVCPQCGKRVRWSKQFAAPACMSADGGCGWKGHPPKGESGQQQKQ